MGKPYILESYGDNEVDERGPFGWNEIADIASEFGISIFFSPVLFYDTQNASRNLLRV